MSDNSAAVSPYNPPSPSYITSPSNLNSTSSTDLFNEFISGGWWFAIVSGLIDRALGFPANVWSLHVMVTSGGQRWSLVESEIITLNLVAMEIGSALCFILVVICRVFVKSMTMLNWLGFPAALAFSVRALLESLICLERYLAVVHPVVFLRYKPLRYRLACCGLVWLLAVGYSGLLTLLFHTVDQWVSSITILVLIVTVLSIDLFCSLSILRVLRQPGPGDGGREMVREKNGGGKEEDREKDDGEEGQTAAGGGRGKVKEGERAVEMGKERMKEGGKNQQKRRAFRIVSFMIGMLVFNSVPLIMCAPLHYVLEDQVFMEEVFPALMSLSQMGSVVPALLHLHRAGRLPCLTTTTRGHQQNN